MTTTTTCGVSRIHEHSEREGKEGAALVKGSAIFQLVAIREANVSLTLRILISVPQICESGARKVHEPSIDSLKNSTLKWWIQLTV